MTMMQPEKFLRSMRKTPVILAAILRNVSQERAATATDGPDGWSVLEVMCHMRDFEGLFFRRARMMLESENPELPGYDQNELVKTNDYAGQKLSAAFQDYVHVRQQFVHFLAGLNDEQWHRRGIHPDVGDIDLLELVMNVSLHDINHIEQIVRALGLSEGLIS